MRFGVIFAIIGFIGDIYCVYTLCPLYPLPSPLLDPEHHVPLIKIPPDTSQEPRGGRDLQQSNGKKVKSNGIKKIINYELIKE